MTALRYDTWIRRKVIAFRTETDGIEFLSDFSIFKRKTAKEVYAEARNFNKLSFGDTLIQKARPKEKQPANPPTLPAKPKERWRGGYKSHATILITTRAATATATITTKVAADPPMTGEATAGMEEITKTEEMVIDSETSNPNEPPERTHTGSPLEDTSHVTKPEMREHIPPTPAQTTVWPEEIISEMNVQQWVDALQNTALLPEFQDVLNGFEHGFNQGIPEHNLGNGTCFYTPPPNHSSALLAKDRMEESIKKEIQAGQEFGPYSTDQLSTRFAFFRTNPSGAVVKGDGSVRPVNNLSFPRNKPKIPSVSSSVDKSDYTTTWDNFKTVSRFLRRQTKPLKEPTLEDQHFLLGYRWNTLLSYSTGIRKYLKFANENAESPTGHDIAANTLVKYLAGLQAWHLYHEVKYPDTKQKKKAAGLAILLGIVDCSVNTSEEGKVIVDSATVAFWGWQEFPSSLPNLNPGPYEKRQHS
ncbi:hypothetical protein MJO28_013941 [Puccinia striiformis f. sp. tritici]|uniref:Uncharacterized protein n=1 Tax=Puccinia striiformis f. sp. tritici TaxID=168172 RepID=A0ACC0DXW3_9BASI|nr:hypothetical protein MJO28_013941 [Puccinia striiformis f. sp. tritici]